MRVRSPKKLSRLRIPKLNGPVATARSDKILVRAKGEASQGVIFIGLLNKFCFGLPQQTAAFDIPENEPAVACRIRNQFGRIGAEFNFQNIMRVACSRLRALRRAALSKLFFRSIRRDDRLWLTV